MEWEVNHLQFAVSGNISLTEAVVPDHFEIAFMTFPHQCSDPFEALALPRVDPLIGRGRQDLAGGKTGGIRIEPDIENNGIDLRSRLIRYAKMYRSHYSGEAWIRR